MSYLVLRSFNCVSRMFKGCLKFQGCFKQVPRKLRVFLESFKGVAKSFRCGSLRGVLKALKGVFKKLSGVFQECLKGV